MEQKVSTQEKLKSIINGFDEFDTEMKIGTRQRREKDEHRVSELKIEMTRLEKALHLEVVRRTEVNKALEQWCEEKIKEMKAEFYRKLEENQKAVHHRLQMINDDIKVLEDHFQLETERIPKEIEAKGAELATMLKEFEVAFDEERASRIEREAKIVRQIDDHDTQVNREFEEERTSRENTYADLIKVLDKNVALRSKGDAKLKAMVEEELASLRNAVAKERQIREREDDEIVDALNRYTSKLQMSLRLLNSSEA